MSRLKDQTTEPAIDITGTTEGSVSFTKNAY